jgi:hypothetical protein
MKLTGIVAVTSLALLLCGAFVQDALLSRLPSCAVSLHAHIVPAYIVHTDYD